MYYLFYAYFVLNNYNSYEKNDSCYLLLLISKFKLNENIGCYDRCTLHMLSILF